MVDSSGIIRSYSRLKYANVAIDEKSPIFLNKKHKLAELVVIYYHVKCLHRGVRQTLTELRSMYWIVKGRSFVKKSIRSCTICKRLNVRAYSYPNTPDLPEFRFDFLYPFSTTAIDYFGPLFCLPVFKVDAVNLYKAWVVLFTCTSTRAISLEVVNSSSSCVFLQCFDRFVSRRGCPNRIITDNGSVFTSEETQKYMAIRYIESRFTLDAAPWQGGLWERLVACVKRCLKMNIGVKMLNYIELQTIIAEMERVLNNRPIGADYENDREDVITPNHLICGRRIELSNDSKDAEDDRRESRSIIKRRRFTDVIIDHFWSRWQHEYLEYLRENQRKFCKTRSMCVPKVNDVVIIYDDKLPRHLWRVGLIIKLIDGNDGKCRGAEVRLSKTRSIIKRPINKLYPLVTNEDLEIRPFKHVSLGNVENK